MNLSAETGKDYAVTVDPVALRRLSVRALAASLEAVGFSGARLERNNFGARVVASWAAAPAVVALPTWAAGASEA